jgi:hypothetical protein
MPWLTGTLILKKNGSSAINWVLTAFLSIDGYYLQIQLFTVLLTNTIIYSITYKYNYFHGAIFE